jgi:hypothetical protein
MSHINMLQQIPPHLDLACPQANIKTNTINATTIRT